MTALLALVCAGLLCGTGIVSMICAADLAAGADRGA